MTKPLPTKDLIRQVFPNNGFTNVMNCGEEEL